MAYNGSQGAGGKEVLKKVVINSKKLVVCTNDAISTPVKIAWKPVLKDADQIKKVIDEVNPAKSA